MQHNIGQAQQTDNVQNLVEKSIAPPASSQFDLNRDVSSLNKEFNKKYKIYKDVLAPEIQKNEELKREHKRSLIELTGKIIYTNFGIVLVSIAVMFGCVLFCDKIDLAYCKELLSFLKYFLTAIFAEFVSILFFIVKNVFDTSISDIFKQFDKAIDKGSINKGSKD